MTHAQETEQKWVKRGIGLLVVLAFALFVVTTWSVVQTANDRAAAADRAERTAAELQVLAQRLDRQTAALDRQAAALDEQASALAEQADALQDRAVQADRSRAQFREAAREILEQLGSDLDAFEVETSSAPATAGRSPTRDSIAPPPQPEPEPEPEPTVTATSEPAPPGCVKSGGRPKRCDGDN